MSEIILYEKESNLNILEHYKSSCNIFKNSPVSTNTNNISNKYGKFIFEKEEIIDDEKVKDYYSDKTKQLMLIKLRVKVIQVGDKVSIRFYYTNYKRLVGGQYFKISRDISFVTYNLKSKNFYHGTILKKRKKLISKKIRCNNFQLPFLTEIKLSIRRNFNYNASKNINWQDIIYTNSDKYTNIGDEVSITAVRRFMYAIYNKTKIHFDYRSNYLEGELYKLFLKHNNISYPDSVIQYTVLKTPKKELIKEGNLTNYFMVKNQIKGRHARKILNKGNDIDFFTLNEVFHNLGVDHFNLIRESFFSKGSRGMESTWYITIEIDKLNLYSLSNVDKKRIVNLINSDIEVSWSIIKEHLYMIKSLLRYGENFTMKFKSKEEFNLEHYEISELTESYKKGKIKRTYSKEFIDDTETTIIVDDKEYHPTVLCTSGQYNEESQTQSNCVRNYSEKPESIIISLRKDDCLNNVRATIEYKITDNNLIRVQNRGRFNSNLDYNWDEPMRLLDDKVKKIYNSKKFTLPEMTKEFKNGNEIHTKSVFQKDEYGTFLVWENYENDLPFNGIDINDDLPF